MGFEAVGSGVQGWRVMTVGAPDDYCVAMSGGALVSPDKGGYCDSTPRLRIAAICQRTQRFVAHMLGDVATCSAIGVRGSRCVPSRQMGQSESGPVADVFVAVARQLQ